MSDLIPISNLFSHRMLVLTVGPKHSGASPLGNPLDRKLPVLATCSVAKK